MGRLRPNKTPGYQVERGAGRPSLGVRQSPAKGGAAGDRPARTEAVLGQPPWHSEHNGLAELDLRP